MLRYRRPGLAGLGIAFALGLGACNADDLTAVNTDPNNPTSAPPAAVFTNAVRVTMQRWYGSTPENQRGPVLTAQHLAQAQYPDEDQYLRLDGATTEAAFNGAYFNQLKNFQVVIDAGQGAVESCAPPAPACPRIWGPAQIMRSLVFGWVTDVWGDVPYSDALRGEDQESGSLLPAYDEQKDIYSGLFSDLDEAVEAIADGAGTLGLGAADPIYGGNALRWQRFGNSLRARHAMRLANVDASTAQAQLNAAINAPGGLMQSNADNAQMVWPGDGVYNNPWSVNHQTRDDHRLSQTLMNEMLPRQDPRVPVYAQPTTADTNVYAGMPNGLSASVASAYISLGSRPGRVFYSTTRFCPGCPSNASFPSFILTYAEVQFTLAEARERGWIATGTAAGYYEAGIRASMEQWGVTDEAAINAYLARADVVYEGGVAGQRQIALQKWIALYTDGVEAWAEWRRTCVPATLKPGPAAVISTVPRRYLYPPREHSVNAANVAAVTTLDRQGPDEFTSRMYWDRNPTAAPTYPGATCGVR